MHRRGLGEPGGNIQRKHPSIRLVKAHIIMIGKRGNAVQQPRKRGGDRQ